ncbi:hypothetical protein FOZ63_015095, partial [Perkinsus olseni]
MTDGTDEKPDSHTDEARTAVDHIEAAAAKADASVSRDALESTPPGDGAGSRITTPTESPSSEESSDTATGENVNEDSPYESGPPSPAASSVEENKRMAEAIHDGLPDDPLDRLLTLTDAYAERIHRAASVGIPLERSPRKRSSSGGSGIDTHQHRGQTREQDEDQMLLQLEQEEDEEKQEVPGKKVMISGRMSQPDTIIGTMRPYQLDGLTWMCQLCVAHVNGILADEMGLGKTLQTISLLTTVTSKGWVHPPHMVVGPKTTLLNWAGEFKKFCPSMRIILLHGTHDERRETIEEYLMDVPQPKSFDVLLTTFDVCRIEKAALRKIRWGYFVMDEAHRIKNDQSSLSQVVRSFTTQRRLLLTGTPLQNNLQELWALLNFLMPSVFTNAKQFD